MANNLLGLDIFVWTQC